MFVRQRVPSIYSRAELVSDAAIHIVGIVSAIVAVAVLLSLTLLWFGDMTTVAAAGVYGLSLIAMFSCSALYNMSRLPARKDVFRRIDQSAIYMKIAGSYTPFAVLTGTHMGYFLTGVWSAALAGASLILFGPVTLRRPSLVLYLAIGWAGLVAGQPMVAGLTSPGFVLVVAAGTLYTAGVIFYLWEELPFHNTIWHVFVFAASFVLYAAVMVELWGRAPAG